MTIFAPILGMLIDKFGYHIILCLIASVSMIIANIIFMMLPDCNDPNETCYDGIIPYIIIGFGMTILFVVSDGTIIAFLVDE